MQRLTPASQLRSVFAKALSGCALAAVASTTAMAQATILSSPGDFSGGETVIEFEATTAGPLVRGDTVSDEYADQGVTFALTDGGSPWVETVDGTMRQFGPQGANLIGNLDPLVPAPPPYADMLITFEGHVNRFACEVKTNVLDDVVMEVWCVRQGILVDTLTFITSFQWQWLGFESSTPFDQLLFAVTDVSNGSFRFDNLRFECAAPGGCEDTTVPDVDINDPLDGAFVNTTSVDVTASVVDESVTTVTSTPSGITITLPPGGGMVTGTLTLVEGPNTISVTATDAFDNTGGNSIGVTVDTIPPTNTVLSPADGTVLASSPASVSVQVADATATTVTFGTNSFSLPAGGGIASGDVDLVTGDNPIAITSTDAAGNATTTTLNVFLDPTAPLITIDDPADGACFGPGEESMPITVTIDDLSETSITSTPPGLSGTVPAGGGSLTGAIALAEGSNTIVVEATDAAGTDASTSIVVILDTTAPTVMIDSPADGQAIRGTVDFDVRAADVGPGSGIARVDFLVDGLVVHSATAPPFTFDLDTTPLAEGSHSLSAAAYDGKGNASTESIQVTVDSIAPTIMILDPSVGELLAGLYSFDALVDDSGSGLVSVTMRVDGTPPNVTDGSATFEPPAGSMLFSSVDDSSLRLDGLSQLTVVALDAAGNMTTLGVTVEFDNTAPEKLLENPVNGAWVNGLIDITAKATDPHLASLEIIVDGDSLGISATSPFTVPFDTSSRFDGAMNIKVVAVDLAGNSSHGEATVTVNNNYFEIRPETLNIASPLRSLTVTALLEGTSLNLMMPTDDYAITLSVPGGSPVPALTGIVLDDVLADDDGDGIPNLRMKFDRRRLVAAIQAGIAAGMIQPHGQTIVTFAVEGFVLGQDRLFLVD